MAASEHFQSMVTNQHPQRAASRLGCPHVATLAIQALLTIPGNAYANVGTPLMIASAFHLVIGNTVIGLIEAAILAWLLQARFWKAALLMILGNYVAWWACGFLFPALEWIVNSLLGTNPLLNVKAVIAAAAVAAFFASLAIEAPFSYLVGYRPWSRRGQAIPSRRRFLLSHVLAQAVTYALLALWYTSASTASLLWIEVRSAVPPQLPKGTILFKDSLGRVARIPLRGGAVELLKGQTLEAKQSDFWSARMLDPNSDWTIRMSYWQTGVVAEHKSGTELRVALNTPLINWRSSNATVLPGGFLVYQLGKQIVVLDMNRRVIAPLVAGTEPHVTLE